MVITISILMNGCFKYLPNTCNILNSNYLNFLKIQKLETMPIYFKYIIKRHSINCYGGDRQNPSLFSAQLSTRKPTGIDPRGHRLATNRRSHAVATMSLPSITNIMRYVFCYHCCQLYGQRACLHMIVSEESNPHSDAAQMPNVRSEAKRTHSNKTQSDVQVRSIAVLIKL